jgi:uncharacterized membrane protein YjfL (UPF0719 family)
MELEQLGRLLLQIFGWSLGGMVALLISRYAYQLIAPFDARKELIIDRNTAVGASKGMFLIASGIILHGIIVGEKLTQVLWQEVLYMLGIYLMSFIMLWLGRLALVKLSPFDFDEQIHIKDNLAVGIIEGCYYVAFAIIIHSAL